MKKLKNISGRPEIDANLILRCILGLEEQNILISYKEIEIKKGKKIRKIFLPNENLKKYQKRILFWLYRKYKPKRKNSKAIFKFKNSQIFTKTKDILLKNKNSILNFINTGYTFLLSVDVSNAYNSTKKNIFFKIFKDILIKELISYRNSYLKYKKNINKNYKKFYSKDILFSNKNFFLFRRKMREMSNQEFDIYVEDFSTYFTEEICKICTWKDSLPQGVCTSSIFFNLVVDDFIISFKKELKERKIKIKYLWYYDNIFFLSKRKIGHNFLFFFKSIFEKNTDLVLNKKKNKFFDLKKHTPNILGVTIIKKENSFIFTIKKEMQEKIRNLFFLYKKNPNDDILKKKIKGYLLYIIDIIPIISLPNNIKKIIKDFFKIYQV